MGILGDEGEAERRRGEGRGDGGVYSFRVVSYSGKPGCL